MNRAAVQLDEVLERWRTWTLGETRYVYLDARHEKVRLHGQVRDAAVLIAMGVLADGKRTILGLSVSVGEHEVHWCQFLQGLVARGLMGVQLVVSDAHEGLGAARKAVFEGSPWQRCHFHLQQNAQAYAPRQELKAEVAAAIRAILTEPGRRRCHVQKYAKTASKLAAWMETALPEGVTVCAFPPSHRQRLRTVNGLERFN